jgi:hypothetical protein
VFAALCATSAAGAQSPPNVKLLNRVPAQSVTVTDYYEQNVHDRSNNKIGEIVDVLLSPDGKVSAFIVGVGGFLDMGEKDVAVPFDAIKHEVRDNKIYQTMDATKDTQKAAPRIRYDRNPTTWVPDTENTGSGTVRK